MERRAADRAYLDEHWIELLQEYPESWVAVHNKAVVRVERDLEKLIEDLKETGVDLRSVVIDYLSTRPLQMLL